MKFHSMVFDDFFENPLQVKKSCDEMPMMNYPASDGVIYPGIIELPKDVRKQVVAKFKEIYGKAFSPELIFGRYSMVTMDPPNWAHSDGNMAQMLGLIYMSPSFFPDAGTYFLKHEKGFELHPRDEMQKQRLLQDSNERELWEKTHYCEFKFNRLFILSADYVHGAGKSFGFTQQDSRFVISVFFNVKG